MKRSAVSAGRFRVARQLRTAHMNLAGHADRYGLEMLVEQVELQIGDRFADDAGAIVQRPRRRADDRSHERWSP